MAVRPALERVLRRARGAAVKHIPSCCSPLRFRFRGFGLPGSFENLKKIKRVGYSRAPEGGGAGAAPTPWCSFLTGH